MTELTVCVKMVYFKIPLIADSFLAPIDNRQLCTSKGATLSGINQ